MTLRYELKRILDKFFVTDAELNTKLTDKSSIKINKNQIDDFPSSIPPEAHTHTKAQITDFPSTMTPSSHTHTKAQITDFPSTMTPSSHTHTKNQISDFAHNHSASEVTYNNQNLKTVLDSFTEWRNELLDTIYPVGSIYMSVTSTNPSTLFGGTWQKIEGKFLLASSNNYSNGTTGGAETVTLTTNEMPSHTHTQNSHKHGTGHNEADKFLIYSGTNIAINSVGRKWTSSEDGTVFYVYEPSGDGGIYEKKDTSSVTATNKNTGGGAAHNNMPPYLVVNVWKRTA